MIIALVSQKGGVGKTTLSLNLANALQHLGKSVAIVETDAQKSLARLGSLLEKLELQPTPEPLEKLLEWPYDYVIIDTPPYLSKGTEDALKIADITLVPIQPSLLDAQAATDTLEMIQDAREKANPNLKTAIIINRSQHQKRNHEVRIQEALEQFDIPILPTRIRDLIAYRRSLLKGGIFMLEETEKEQAEIKSLLLDILTLANS